MGVECPRALYTGEMAVTPRDELARALEPLLGLSSLLISATPVGTEKIAGDTVPYKHPSYVRRSGFRLHINYLLWNPYNPHSTFSETGDFY